MARYKKRIAGESDFLSYGENDIDISAETEESCQENWYDGNRYVCKELSRNRNATFDF